MAGLDQYAIMLARGKRTPIRLLVPTRVWMHRTLWRDIRPVAADSKMEICAAQNTSCVTAVGPLRYHSDGRNHPSLLYMHSITHVYTNTTTAALFCYATHVQPCLSSTLSCGRHNESNTASFTAQHMLLALHNVTCLHTHFALLFRQRSQA